MRVGKLLCLSFLLLSVTVGSCGKKGDPFLPALGGVGRITLIEGERDGEGVDLTGRIHGAMGGGDNVRVYYARYPLDQPPCEGCPIENQGFETFGRDSVTGEGFSCRMTGIQPGNLYFFEARLIGPEGRQGPPSNRVRVEVP